MNSLSISPTSDFSDTTELNSLSSFFDGGKPSRNNDRVSNSNRGSSRFPPSVNRWVSWSIIIVLIVYLGVAEGIDMGPFRSLWRKITGEEDPQRGSQESNEMKKVCLNSTNGEEFEVHITFENDLKTDEIEKDDLKNMVMIQAIQAIPDQDYTDGEMFDVVKAKTTEKKLKVTCKKSDKNRYQITGDNTNTRVVAYTIPNKSWKQDIKWCRQFNKTD